MSKNRAFVKGKKKEAALMEKPQLLIKYIATAAVNVNGWKLKIYSRAWTVPIYICCAWYAR